jgi:hypothetical protein
VADAAPPPAPAKKAPGPMRFILLGCGILAGVFLLGMGGCAGVLYFVYQGSKPIGEIGAAYLRDSDAVQSALGAPVAAKQDWLGWNVQIRNDAGNAMFTYSLQGKSMPASATVWLVKSAGKWTPIGAHVRPPSSDEFSIGKPPPQGHRLKWDD